MTTDPMEGYPDAAGIGRLYAAADQLWEAMRAEHPEQVADALTLVELDDLPRGMVVRYSAASDLYDFVWTGRYVGSVAGAFVRGEAEA